MAQNEHVYAIFCRPEVTGDVIADDSVKTIEVYAVVNFEVASFCTFQDIQTKSFRDGGGGGGGHRRQHFATSPHTHHKVLLLLHSAKGSRSSLLQLIDIEL